MVIRALLLAALAAYTAVSTFAQTAAPATPAPGWEAVQALPDTTTLHIGSAVAPKPSRLMCNLTSVTADTLSCEQPSPFGTKKYMFQLGEIKSIARARRAHSAILGCLIGTGVGIAVGGFAGHNSTRLGSYPGAFPLVFGFVGMFSGAPIGYFTDFTRTRIYPAK